MEGVVPIGPDGVNWAPLLENATPQPALLRLSLIQVADTDISYGAPVRVSVDRNLRSSPNAGLRPGLYRVQVGRSIADAWVLLSDPATFEADSTAIATLRDATHRWESDADSIQRSLLRAALHELARERTP
jgi:hypothetical protein